MDATWYTTDIGLQTKPWTVRGKSPLVFCEEVVRKWRYTFSLHLFASIAAGSGRTHQRIQEYVPFVAKVDGFSIYGGALRRMFVWNAYQSQSTFGAKWTSGLGSYYDYSQRRLLHLCHLIDNSDSTFNQLVEHGFYAFDTEVLLFLMLFSHWPVYFYRFFDILHRTVHLPFRPPGYLHYRWRWLLTQKWFLITPRWLLDAFNAYEWQLREYE